MTVEVERVRLRMGRGTWEHAPSWKNIKAQVSVLGWNLTPGHSEGFRQHRASLGTHLHLHLGR